MKNILNHLRQKTFQWFSDWGIGYYPVRDTHYDDAYFEHFEECAMTDIGKRLNAFRLALTRSLVADSAVLDIGIGAGTFLKAHGNCWGFDVNPRGLEWLSHRGRLVDPYTDDLSRFKALTFFDSFEHLLEPWTLLDRIKEQFVVMSLPIFRDCQHVRASKHYKPDEHYWYFTEESLSRFMGYHGFALVSQHDDETRLGREDIQTFVFRRKAMNRPKTEGEIK